MNSGRASDIILVIRPHPKVGAWSAEVLYLYPTGSEEVIWRGEGSCHDNAMPDIEAVVSRSLDEGVTQAVFDLVDTGWANQSFIAALVRLYEKYTSRGGDIVFCNPNERVLGIFRIVELDKAFAILGSIEEAVEYLGRSGGSSCT